MKNLKSLNKNYFTIVISFLFFFISYGYSNEPVDIWKVEAENNEVDSITNRDKTETSSNSIYKMQSQKIDELKIEEDSKILSKKIQVSGLYDPSENDLTIDIWTNSDGDKIKNILKKINKMNLSNDAKEILNISLFTNSYSPQKNITYDEFYNIKLNWLIKNKDLNLISEYLIKNKDVDKNSELIRFLVDHYLSNSQLKKACSIFSKINDPLNDNYLSNFNIYCLVNSEKREEAQLLFDLKKELGSVDDFFEKKFNHLMKYEILEENLISEKSILDFHLSHRVSAEFEFQPNENTSKNIWKYLSTSNLLDNIENVDIEDQNKIKIIEKATHEQNYTEEELFELYKRFQFSINQLLNIKESYKLLSNTEARALLYQGILITTEIEPKLELTKTLKDQFIAEGIENAFTSELAKILKEIEIDEIPSNYTSFYEQNLKKIEINQKKIKINNKIIHQSKLLNYFKNNSSQKVTEKNLNDLLKKIKRDKNYYISTKDIILLESLKSDGIESQKKYKNIYQVDDNDMPTDIQVLINNNEMGLVLLRLVEVIGQDELKDIGPETLYFIISALNQLDIDKIRNKILLKVLPLKV